MPLLFEQLANSNGKTVTVCSITKGGRKLESYTDPSDDVTQALDTLLSKQNFDLCFIQEQSLLPASDYSRFIIGLDCVVNKLKDRADRIVLYATWGRKAGNAELTKHNWTTESMAGMLSQAYQKAAQLYDACVSPVGNNFLSVMQAHPELNLYSEDCSHPSYAGSCLAALTHYHTVFGEFPKQTGTLSLSDAEIAAFRAAICQ